MRPTAWAVTRPPGFFRRSASTGLVYARHGRELMGCKSPVRESSHCRDDRVNQVLAEGKGVSARRGLEEAGAQSYEPTNRNSIQGHHPDKSAQHDEAHGFRRNGKCCGCVATVHVLIRGDLLHFAFRKKGAATVKVVVMEQKSAEAIVDKDSTTHGGVVAGNEPG